MDGFQTYIPLAVFQLVSLHLVQHHGYRWLETTTTDSIDIGLVNHHKCAYFRGLRHAHYTIILRDFSPEYAANESHQLKK